MKADAKAEAAPVGGGSKKKLVIILAGVLVLALAGGGGAWFMLKGDSDEHVEDSKSAKKPKKAKHAGPPVYVPVDQFTVNLQPDEGGEQYLQLAITLQASSLEESEAIKTNMPKLRSRILLLLSSKHASEINTPEGKQQLSKEILDQVNQPFESEGEHQEVAEVLFTAFIIQ